MSKSRSQRSSQPSASQSRSQLSQSQSSSSRGAGSSQFSGREELQTLIGECVQYILISDKRKFPVKKPDIVKNVLKGNSKLFPEVFEQAKNKLKNVFGFELVEVEEKRGSYIVRNKLWDKLRDQPPLGTVTWDDNEMVNCGFLTLILTIIYMNGNVITDEELMNFLNQMGIRTMGQPDDIFGDIKKVLQEYIRQLYLVCTPVEGSEPTIYEYRWGQRAFSEVRKRDILAFVSEVTEMDSSQWQSQYEDAQQEHELRDDSPNEMDCDE